MLAFHICFFYFFLIGGNNPRVNHPWNLKTSFWSKTLSRILIKVLKNMFHEPCRPLILLNSSFLKRTYELSSIQALSNVYDLTEVRIKWTGERHRHWHDQNRYWYKLRYDFTIGSEIFEQKDIISRSFLPEITAISQMVCFCPNSDALPDFVAHV